MSISADQPAEKRGYDARSRRQRAQRERADTRERVLAAARARFLADGYTETKMLDIASDAGLAIASVYRAGSSKAELIEMILERATTGGEPGQHADRDQDEDQPLTFAAMQPPQYPLIAAEPDPQQRVAMIVNRIADILDWVGPLWTVLRDAASVDAGAAATMRAMLERRAAAFEVAIDLLPPERLRLSSSESVDTLWALSSPDTYLMLRTVRGWSHHAYQDWLHDTLITLLLKPAT